MVDKFLLADANLGHRDWPEYVPKDLELRLLDALSYQSCTQADIWEEVKEWLEENLFESTEMVDGQRSIPATTPSGCTKFSDSNVSALSKSKGSAHGGRRLSNGIDNEVLVRRIAELELVIADYARRYGLTNIARKSMVNPATETDQ